MAKEDLPLSIFSDIAGVLEIISSKEINSLHINTHGMPVVKPLEYIEDTYIPPKLNVFKQLWILSKYFAKDPLDTLYETYWASQFQNQS